MFGPFSAHSTGFEVEIPVSLNISEMFELLSNVQTFCECLNIDEKLELYENVQTFRNVQRSWNFNFKASTMGRNCSKQKILETPSAQVLELSFGPIVLV